MVIAGEVLEAGTLVVAAVVVVVLVAVVDVGPEEGVGEEVELGVLDAEVKEAEYAAQRPRPTDSAILRSVALQLVMRQGATREAMAFLAVPHWQPVSDGWQPAEEMAVWRQGTCRCAMD